MRTNTDGLVHGKRRELVPKGQYRARLVAVAPFKNAHGERMGFSYEITEGPHLGAIVMQSAAVSVSPTSKYAALLDDLLNRVPTPAELRDGPGPEHIGRSCHIIVHEGRSQSGTPYSSVLVALWDEH